jgi:hypothetical protein
MWKPLSALVVCAIALGSCAHEQRWYREGAVQRDFEMDKGQCNHAPKFAAAASIFRCLGRWLALINLFDFFAILTIDRSLGALPTRLAALTTASR